MKLPLLYSAIALALSVAGSAWAQRVSGEAPAVRPASGPLVTEPAAAGPIIYLVDSNGALITFNVTAKTAHIVGYTGQSLTDIAFHPKTHVLYGVSFSALYTINTKTAAATFVGSISNIQANALYIGASGKAYTADPNEPGLYEINLKTAATALVGSGDGVNSGGDISPYYSSMILATTSSELATINPVKGTLIKKVPTTLTNLFGLASPSKGKLYGFAQTIAYQLFPNATTAAGTSKAVVDLSKFGVATIDGAAFDGNYHF